MAAGVLELSRPRLERLLKSLLPVLHHRSRASPVDMSTHPAPQATAKRTNELLAAAHGLQQAGQVVDAERAYRDALKLAPSHHLALHGLGSLLTMQKRYPEAVHSLRAAITAVPGQPHAHVELAQALRGLGLNEEAATHFDSAAQLSPGDRQIDLMARLHRATLFDEQGNNEQALACFEAAVRQHPDSADAWAGLGMVQLHFVGPEAAGQSFQRALQIDPDRPAVIEKFALVLQEQRLYEDAAIAFERLMQRWPDHPLTAGRLLHCKLLTADWLALDELQAHVESGLAAGALTSEPFGLQGYCASPALLMQGTQAYAATYFPDQSSQLRAARIGRGPKIRVGYLAGEFRNQATSVLLTEVLELHDRSRFEVFAFDNGWSDGSTLRRRIEAATSVVPIRSLDNLNAANAIRERGIDILVNLNGYFGHKRTHVFALRPAPIQVNYLGFPGTIGAPYIDYIIADPVVIPPSDQRFYAEKVVYLPDCYQPNDSQRRVADVPQGRAAAGLPADAFVFCCMNNVYKIMPAVFDVWMRLLQRVPGSVLLLYSDVPEAQVNLRYEARARGVDPARIVFGAPWGHERHLARLRMCDLFLDTWPYNAHTTGSDALWAGLPVLTCAGPSFPSRVGASLLRAVGLPELVTESFADYEALAYRLATEPALLANLRERLAANLPTAPLYDTPRYTRHLEAAYEQMVARARSGLPAHSISIDAMP